MVDRLAWAFLAATILGPSRLPGQHKGSDTTKVATPRRPAPGALADTATAQPSKAKTTKPPKRIAHDTVYVPITAVTGGPTRCSLGLDSAVDSVSVADTIILAVQIYKGQVSTLERSGSDLLLSIDGAPVGVVQGTESQRSLAFQADDLYDHRLDITRIPGGVFVCSTDLRRKPRGGGLSERGFLFFTGVEFASADGFASKETRIPVTAIWKFTLRTDSTFGITRVLSLTAVGEAASVVKNTTFATCRVVSSVRTGSTPPPSPPGACGPQQVTHFGTDSVAVSQYVDSIDHVAGDTTLTTGAVWRALAILRWDYQIAPHSAAVFGPVAYAGIQTNPNVPATNSLGVRWGIGLSFRELGGRGLPDHLDLEAFYGQAKAFPVEIRTSRTTIGDTTSTRLMLPEGMVTVKGFLFRVLMAPGAGFYIRGYAELNRGGLPSFATLAILRSIDLGQVLTGILGQTGSQL